jgi:hypothetical protein
MTPDDSPRDDSGVNLGNDSGVKDDSGVVGEIDSGVVGKLRAA